MEVINKLIGHDHLFNHLTDLYFKKKLPNKILLSGKKGIGKFLLASHYVNFILSQDEKFKYNLEKLEISNQNKSYILFKNNTHPNIFLMKKYNDKKYIEILQIREMIKFQNNSSFNNKTKFIIIDNVNDLNINSTNALLKSIEQPNNNVIYILIHNSCSSIQETLKSRCIEFKLFQNYVEKFAARFDVEINGLGGPMTSAINSEGLSIINFGIGSANAATIMDLLSCINPKGVLFLGKCGGLKKTTDIGHFILPTAAIRGEGTSNDYFPKEVPAMPSFKLHKYVSDILVDKKIEYRTGVVYSTNRRVWEHDEKFKKYLRKVRVMGIDMETATIFITGFSNEINRGALLLVSDTPMVPEGIKTQEKDQEVTRKYVDLHINMGIEAMTRIGDEGEQIKHFKY